MNLHSAFQTICSAVETTLSACGGGDVPARWMVACSGGMDSVVLLHAARKVLGPDHCLVAHLDHGLRGGESEADAAWVTSLARELALEIGVETLDVSRTAARTGESVEMAGRRLRREALSRLAVARGCKGILLAHHRDDQAETVLLQLLRGGGPESVASMPRIRKDGGLLWVRPLLALSRQCLADAAAEEAFSWREDASNQDTTILRNRIRHRILPQMMEEFHPAIAERLAGFAGALQEDNQVLGERAREFLDQVPVDEGLPCTRLNELPASIRRRVLVRWLDGLDPPVAASATLLDRLMTAVRRSDGSEEIPRPGGGHLIRVYDRLTAPPQESIRNWSHPFPWQGVLPLPEARLQVEVEPVANRPETLPRPRLGVFPVEAFIRVPPGPATWRIRSWKDGDWIRPYPPSGRKKLQDLFGNAKVPAPLRHRIPILECEGTVAWVASGPVAEGFEVAPGAPCFRVRVTPLGFQE